jgi:hypothetical protein
MPHYEIKIDGKKVVGGLSLRRVSDRLRARFPEVGGISNTTLSRRVRDSGVFRKEIDGIEIEVQRVDSENRRAIPRGLRNFQEQIGGARRTITLNQQYTLTPFNVNYIVDLVGRYIRENFTPEQISTTYFLTRIVGQPVANRTGNVIANGVFENYNQMLETLFNNIMEVLERYVDAEVFANSIIIETQNRPEPEDVIVFGEGRLDVEERERKTLEELLYHPLCSCPPRAIFECKCSDKREFIEWLSGYRLISPSSYKNCIFQACYIASKMRRDVSASVNTFIIRHIKGKVKSLTPKVLLKKLAYTLKCDIRATYITDRLEQKVYRYKENEESPTPLEILIYEGHSYALIPKEEGGEIFLKKYDKEEKCYKVEIVPDIRHKEQELILSPNYEERKENKCRIATFDLETCDKENREFKGELLRTDTEVYSFGYYDEGTLAKYHSRIKRRKDDDILSLFLLYLQYKVEGDVIIYAHNGGRFDNFLLLSKILQSFNWRIEQYLESNGRVGLSI